MTEERVNEVVISGVVVILRHSTALLLTDLSASCGRKLALVDSDLSASVGAKYTTPALSDSTLGLSGLRPASTRDCR